MTGSNNVYNLQLGGGAFNVFNHTQRSGAGATVNYASPTNPTRPTCT